MIRALLSLACFFLTFAARAEIVESKTMAEAFLHADPGTLIIFDLDNTVLEAVQTMGSDQYFGHVVAKFEKRGIGKDAAVVAALLEVSRVQPVTRVRAVEKETPRAIADLQDFGYTVFALTARPREWKEGTLRQVASLNVDFRRTSPRIDGEIANAGTFENGVLFLAPKLDKGTALLSALDRAQLRPAKILFIDDKLSNVTSVEKTLNTTTIPHVSVRYGAADARVAAFDAKVADCQWQIFLWEGDFISDEQAKDELNGGSCRNIEASAS